MLLSIRTGLYHNHHNNNFSIFMSFPTSRIGKSPLGLSSPQTFLRSSSMRQRHQLSSDLERVWYEGSASLSMCTMDHLMSWCILAVTASFFKLKQIHYVQMKVVTDCSTYVLGFIIIAKYWLFVNFLRVFQLGAVKIADSGPKNAICFGSFSNGANTFTVLRYRTSSIIEVLPHWICA